MDTLFFSLVQVSLGLNDSLVSSPTTKEWDTLLEMAIEQSIAGVCFSGVCFLYHSVDNDSNAIQWNRDHCSECMTEEQYYNWLAIAIQIQSSNKLANEQCGEITKILQAKGAKLCVLKGQGIAHLYKSNRSDAPINLCELRQPGDIDLWINGSKESIVELAKTIGDSASPNYMHVETCYQGTSVELHYRPTYMRALKHNRIIQQFCAEHTNDWICDGDIIVPSVIFNRVFILSHIFRHLLGTGIGMRQIMDYYFVLTSSVDDMRAKRNEVEAILTDAGLIKFAGAVMWVMQNVFLLADDVIICKPDIRRGKALLKAIMKDGNLGLANRQSYSRSGLKKNAFIVKLIRKMQQMKYYPIEVLSEPVWRCKLFFDN